MRFLIIDDDAAFRRLLRYHVEVEWPDAACEEYQPSASGALPEHFALGRIDLVLLGHPVAGESGLRWLADLLRRVSCPPVILFADDGDELLAVDALKTGAANYFPKSALKHRRLIETIRAETASPRHDATVTLFDGRRGIGGANRHRFVRTLYRGDLTSVYLAEDEASGRPVVFKVLKYVPDTGGGHLFDRFLQEYEVIAQIRHPNIVRIFDLGIADDHAYIAMEYLTAGSLAQRLVTALEVRLALSHTRQVADALAAIHAAGVLHRDLKPANIMFRDDGTLALIDFGLAKQLRLEAEITGTGQIFGTPYYMSPEQGHAERADGRADVYSLGCILYQMLTGERPFRGATPMAVIYKHTHAPRPKLPEELAELQPVLGKMLAVGPAERFQSAAEVIAALDRVSPSFV